MYKIKGLSYKYKKNKASTLVDINLEIKKGEILGLLGPSGAGKSTFQNILIKLIDDYNGEVLFDGKDIKRLKQDYYNEIGVCFELPVMIENLTCLENIKFLSNFYKNNIDYNELLKEVGLWEHRNKLVNSFSKGMKMRLNFIRAMLNNPKVLFLDEPTNGLDPISALKIKKIIKEYSNKGNTVIITTHLMKDVEEICDKVAFIKNGRIIETGTPIELRDKYGKKEVQVVSKTGCKVFDFNGINKNDEFMNLIKSEDLVSIDTKTMSMEEIFKLLIGGEDNE